MERDKKRERRQENRHEIPFDPNVKQSAFKTPLVSGTTLVCKGHFFQWKVFFAENISSHILCLYIGTSITLITAVLWVQKIDGASDTASGINGAEPDELLNLYVLHKLNPFM